MSTTITVPSKLSIKSIDSAQEELRTQPGSTLAVSPALGFRSILAAASYIQFLLSWAKGKHQKKVLLNVKTEEELNFLATHVETFIPIALATEVHVHCLETNKTEQLNRLDYLQKGLNLFAQLQGGLPVQQDFFGAEEFSTHDIPRKGSRIPLLAVDFAGSHGYPNWFYKGPQDARQLRAPDDFTALVRSVINLLRQQSGRRIGTRIDSLAEDLGAILYELIDNTHRWGRHGLAEDPCDSIRGALFDIRYDFPGNQTRLADIASELPLIGDYVKYHQSKKETKDLGLLEMTVFDGGIGLPARELSRSNIESPSLAQEYAATIACLKKWGTTSQQSGRGLGLDKVLDLASRHKGLVYLRTGSLALYRDFANKPESEASKEGNDLLEKYRLDDAISLNIDPTVREHVEGTVLSIILPFSVSTAP